MARVWRLTEQATESLFEISRWMLQTFGPRQAEIYYDELMTCCEAIAGAAVQAHSCRDRLDPLISSELLFARSGMHLVIFTEIGGDILIVDFLHQQSDLPRRLRSLPFH